MSARAGSTARRRPQAAGGASLLAAALGTLICLAGPGAPSAGGAASSRLQITQVEYRLGLSSATVRAGAVSLLQLDRGHDRHDLRLRREGGGPTIKGRLLAPGKRWEGTVSLAPGVYRLWCTLPEHEARGMHAALRVVR